MLPGLHDSHIHAMLTGASMTYVDLSDCGSIEELQAALSTRCTEDQLRVEVEVEVEVEGEDDGEAAHQRWIIGTNWDQTKLGRYPTRFDLDASCSSRPVSAAKTQPQ